LSLGQYSPSAVLALGPKYILLVMPLRQIHVFWGHLLVVTCNAVSPFLMASSNSSPNKLNLVKKK